MCAINVVLPDPTSPVTTTKPSPWLNPNFRQSSARLCLALAKKNVGSGTSLKGALCRLKCASYIGGLVVIAEAVVDRGPCELVQHEMNVAAHRELPKRLRDG